MPRHNGSRRGCHFRGRSGGRTRRIRKRGKNTYAAKQDFLSPYWVAVGAYSAAGVPTQTSPRRKRLRVDLGRKNHPPPTQKPQKPKPRPKGGSK